MSKWSAADWEKWRASNCRLLIEGWVLGTNIKIDGSIESFAEKDGVKIDRTPEPWKD